MKQGTLSAPVFLLSLLLFQLISALLLRFPLRPGRDFPPRFYLCYFLFYLSMAADIRKAKVQLKIPCSFILLMLFCPYTLQIFSRLWKALQAVGCRPDLTAGTFNSCSAFRAISPCCFNEKTVWEATPKKEGIPLIS